MEVEAWLSQLEAALATTPGGDAEPGAYGGPGGASLGGSVGGSVSGDERAALLDLARIAAHTSERWAAPISTYLAGLAMADVDPVARAGLLRQLVDRLE